MRYSRFEIKEKRKEKKDDGQLCFLIAADPRLHDVHVGGGAFDRPSILKISTFFPTDLYICIYVKKRKKEISYTK